MSALQNQNERLCDTFRRPCDLQHMLGVSVEVLWPLERLSSSYMAPRACQWSRNVPVLWMPTISFEGGQRTR